jgi:transposase
MNSGGWAGAARAASCGYLHKTLVHGARSAVLRVKRERSLFDAWLDTLKQRAPINVVITATTNKLARSP